MPYDEDLANRLREQLVGEEGVTEKKMFGGIAFLVHGTMAVSASGRGGLMLRVAPEDTDDTLSRPHAEVVEMRGRPMRGWIRVAPEGVKTERELSAWVRRGVEFARTLPTKGSAECERTALRVQAHTVTARRSNEPLASLACTDQRPRLEAPR